MPEIPEARAVQRSTVTQLSEWRNRDTATLLRTLAGELERDALKGLVVQAIDHRGKERTYFTGLYKNNSKAAVCAGLTMSVKLTVLQGGFEDET